MSAHGEAQTAALTVPGTPSGTGVSSSQINFTWGASTAGSACTVSYNVYCSTTSGFTPSSSNLVASGLTSPSFADTGLAAATTYYCKVVAADGRWHIGTIGARKQHNDHRNRELQRSSGRAG
ncbi:MAG: fibronectin type III domain-containing protein [Terracidiphilus sp.]